MSEPEEYSEPDVKSKLRSRKKGLLYMYTTYLHISMSEIKEPCRLRKTGLLYNTCGVYMYIHWATLLVLVTI